MRRLRLGAAAGVPSALYVFYVFHYAVNVPYSDDWNMIPIVSLALNGKLGIRDLWSQYGDTRLLVPKLFFVLFAHIDHYDLKHVLVFSAVLFVASYLLLLLLFRSYLGRSLPALPVLLVGVVWFSVVDFHNALWSFQLAWYLSTFFFVATISLLLLRDRHRTLFLVLGTAAAVAGSYSIVQGFVIWPVGLICVLWESPRSRRTQYEAASWISTALITTAIYLHGLNTSNSQCVGGGHCGPGFAFTHPQRLIRFIVLLVGNVIPTTFKSLQTNLVVHEVLGGATAIVAAFIVIQSIRERRTPVSPLPLVLIVYGSLFDLLIAIGRFGPGPAAALDPRYTMPNLILFTGVVVYACAHLPFFGGELNPTARGGRLAILGCVLLCSFLGVQGIEATRYGVKYGREEHQTHITAAREVANLGKTPYAEWGCAAALAVVPPQSPSVALYYLPLRDEIEHRHLSLFQPAPDRRYLALGPPTPAEIVAAGDFADVTRLWEGSC